MAPPPPCVRWCLEEVERSICLRGPAKASYLQIPLCLESMSKMSMLASPPAQWHNLKHSFSLAHCNWGKRPFLSTKANFARAENIGLNCNFGTVKRVF